MSKSTDVATTTPAGLPALPPTSALDGIDAGDVTLPRIKLGQPQADLVINDSVPKGCIFKIDGREDEYPEVLLAAGDEAGLLVHVLGIRKGLSISIDNELTTWAFGDPDAHPDARVTYDYALYLPEHDTQVPYKMLMTSTATSTAKAMNTVLKRNEARGPAYANAFRITTKLRQAEKNGQKFSWFVPIAKTVDADQAHVAEAGQLAGMIAGSSIEQQAPAGDSGPAI